MPTGDLTYKERKKSKGSCLWTQHSAQAWLIKVFGTKFSRFFQWKHIFINKITSKIKMKEVLKNWVWTLIRIWDDENLQPKWNCYSSPHLKQILDSIHDWQLNCTLLVSITENIKENYLWKTSKWSFFWGSSPQQIKLPHCFL